MLEFAHIRGCWRLLKMSQAILEIREGVGGKEAALWAALLWRMYQRYFQKKNWLISVLETEPVTSLISGENALEILKNEAGVHRVQRIPETEKRGRIHTSTASVSVLPYLENPSLTIEPRELRIDVFRSSGHGGQSVNTTDSAVRITHLPTGLVVTSQDERSQLRNRQKALAVLAARLLELKEEERHQKISSERLSQIGRGERAEKIRTYNFPQNRLTDHRLNKSWHNLDKILDGNLDLLRP
ncbi:PCRF domain-containing protein [Candidatus Berkelbacteria bacterium]|nr:PCRF domain-containing protein [Candidatus Berkelbacteria bacterium]